jgi:hypothetical protein
MRRSWLRRARRQSGWRRTATVAADRLVVPAPERPTAHLVPAETGSDGFAVETHVLARLLGVKLLTLEGVVLVSPAQVSQDGIHEPVAPPIPLRAIGDGHPRTLPKRAPARRTDAAGGSSLGEAARLLDECTEELRALDATRIARR